jgi:hypothetical protein
MYVDILYLSQAVSRLLLTVTARGSVPVVRGGHSVTGTGFHQVHQFPLGAGIAQSV